MATDLACPAAPLLPLLLSLTPGAVVGVPATPAARLAALRPQLAGFGPTLRCEAELRHAIGRVPACLVLDARAMAAPLVAAALPALGEAGAVVLVLSDDRGLLLIWCDRILDPAGPDPAWLEAREVRAGRCLELLVEGRAGSRSRVVVPLPPDGGAEAVLASARANGKRVCESRVVYLPPGALTPRAALV